MKPLGMVHTGFSDADLERAPDSARPYIVHDQEKPGEFTRRRARLWPIADTPAGGINVAASDMARYMRLYLADGKVDGAPLVSLDRLKALYEPHVYAGKSQFAEIGESHYGLGLATYHYRGEKVVSHSGGWIGWGTLMSLLPERRCAVTVLTNRTGSPSPTSSQARSSIISWERMRSPGLIVSETNDAPMWRNARPMSRRSARRDRSMRRADL